MFFFYDFGEYKSVKFEFSFKSCLNKVLSYSFVDTTKPSKMLKRPFWLFAIMRVIPDFFHLQALSTGYGYHKSGRVSTVVFHANSSREVKFSEISAKK